MAKYILGVNGWDTRSHDTSATIIKCENGEIKVLAAAEEERFSRIKHAYDSLPVNAVQFCLNEAGITSEELYAVALSWDMPCLYDYRGLKLDFSENDFLSKLFGKMPRKKPKFNFVNHHLSHALSAYSPSGFQESNVMVIDGQGETESLSIWNISNNGVKKLASSGIHASLGYFYESLTEFIGFRGNQAGKTMGLAPYGNNSYFNTLRSLFDIEDLCLNVEHTRGIEYGKTVANYLPIDEQEQLRTLWFKKFRDLLKLSPNDNTKKYSFRSFPKVYRDIAASGQEVLEELLIEIAQKARIKEENNNLCLAGGVALNCVTNGRLLNEFGFNIYVQPASNDAGTSLGAALEIARQEGFSIDNIHMSAYLGQNCSDSEIYDVLQKSDIRYVEMDDASDLIAEYIAKGKIIGLHQGRFEFGPRALGNRSFIANADSEKMLDKINSQVKGREEGRPLAPVMIDTETNKIFGRYVYAPHMTIALPLAIDTIPAVTHVDNTTRPQTIRRNDNPTLYHQIEKIKDEIGVGVVINTSLNYREPIVNRPVEALRLLKNTDTDLIVFNNRFLCYSEK